MAVIKAKQYNLSLGQIIIKSAQLEEVAEIISFVKQVENETNFLMREIGEFNMSEENEIKFIENKLKNAKYLGFIIIQSIIYHMQILLYSKFIKGVHLCLI